MATAQRMVDEAANEAMPDSLLREGKAINKGEEQEGALIKVYHGSGAKGFYEFKLHDGALGKGIYVSSNWDEAVGYAMDKLGVEENEDGYYVWNGEKFDGIGSIGEALESEGYVRAFYANVTDDNDISSSSVYWEDVIALVRDKNMLKSADPVTYDDNGNVIPLSQRFNTKKNDIRYAISDDEIANYANVFGEGEKADFDTSENVGKKRKTYKLTFAQKFFSAKDSAYIELVDEMYGVAKYLKKVGKIGGRADNMIQAIRASRSAAQTMISDKQIDLFGGTDKELGEGLLKIIKPITMRGEIFKYTAKYKNCRDERQFFILFAWSRYSFVFRTEEKRYTPNACQGNYCVNNSAYYGFLATANPGNYVKFKKTDTAPV